MSLLRKVFNGVKHAFPLFTIVIVLIILYMYQNPIVNIETTNVIIQQGQYMDMVATGYAIGAPYNNISKAGKAVVDLSAIKILDTNIFTIAVDPNVIPLNSVVYMDSLGIGIATDTGPAITGNRIDICFSNMNQAMAWGKRNIKVLLLRKGPESINLASL